MILIEFFDANDVENIAGSLLCAPEKVFFIGSNSRLLTAAAQDYTGVLAQRGINTEFVPKSVNRGSLADIILVLTDIVTGYDCCFIDITGGDELFLVAAGAVYTRFPDKVTLHKFNVKSGMLYQCDIGGNTLKAGPATLSVRENALVYGGRVTSSHDERYDVIAAAADIGKLWEVFCDGPSFWNSQCATLSGINLYFPPRDILELDVCKESVKQTLAKHNVKYVCFHSMFKALFEKGLITDFVNDKETLRFVYKNSLVKDCLTKAGLLLELYIHLSAKTLTDKNNAPVYNDVASGVVLDWDGKQTKNAPDVENEIDVLAMRGLVPVFISCKNGAVDINELYKLKTVAERFGGKYAKKVLVSTELDVRSTKGKYIALRANEMDIVLADKVWTLTQTEINRIISQ